MLVAYTIIACNYFIVAVSGYWAFGFTASTAPWLPVIYAPPAVTGAQNWAVVLVNLFGIVQIAGCFQVSNNITRESYLQVDCWLIAIVCDQCYKNCLQDSQGHSQRTSSG